MDDDIASSLLRICASIFVRNIDLQLFFLQCFCLALISGNSGLIELANNYSCLFGFLEELTRIDTISSLNTWNISIVKSTIHQIFSLGRLFFFFFVFCLFFVVVVVAIFGRLLIINLFTVTGLSYFLFLQDIVLVGYVFLGICPLHLGYPIFWFCNCLQYSIIILFISVKSVVMFPLLCLIFVKSSFFCSSIQLRVY